MLPPPVFAVILHVYGNHGFRVRALESPVAELHADDLALRSHPPPDLRDRERADTVEVPEDFARLQKLAGLECGELAQRIVNISQFSFGDLAARQLWPLLSPASLALTSSNMPILRPTQWIIGTAKLFPSAFQRRPSGAVPPRQGIAV